MPFVSSQDLTGSSWVAIVKNTFVDILDPAEPENRRQLKPSLSCDDIPEPTLLTNWSGVQAKTTTGMRQTEAAISEHNSPNPEPSLECEGTQPEQSAAASQQSDLVPIIRNTFVEIFDPSEELCKRQLKPFRTCGDMPDPIIGATSQGLDASAALRSSAGPDKEVAADAPDRQPCVPVAASRQASRTASEELAEIEPETPSYTGSSCASFSDQNFQAGRKRNRSESETGPCTLRPKMDELAQLSGAQMMRHQEEPRAVRKGKVAEAESGGTFHSWAVDARKLRGSDRQLVSPPFSVSLGTQTAMFRLIISPASLTDSKSSLNFQKSSGWGTVQVKCEAVLPEAHGRMAYRIWAGAGERLQRPRGPVYHNFSETAVSSLPRGMDLWDFNVAVDPASSTFTVSFEQISISAISLTDALGTPCKTNRNADEFATTISSQTTSQAQTFATPQKLSMAATQRLPCVTPQRKPPRPLGIPGQFIEMLASVVDEDESSSSSSEDDT
eukprot:TRINITY_DN89750_c0_g1_i1.p1 TRINITY_DN89750_c0_g1~~TRINITY_DN89750_c0_g1_i1.p1  ORF type:complete len:499 (+),score=87.17 TRINITY_DN89750_c0_g1_i1:44-1540(+)